jgi:hypothetical protein
MSDREMYKRARANEISLLEGALALLTEANKIDGFGDAYAHLIEPLQTELDDARDAHTRIDERWDSVELAFALGSQMVEEYRATQPA